MRYIVTLIFATLLYGCGSLDEKALLVNPGDSQKQVTSKMGGADDSQVKDENEAWQYCQTRAGFGVHHYRVVWFYKGQVSGITSYKGSRPASSCEAGMKQINWEDAPNMPI